MQYVRPMIAAHPIRFGRSQVRLARHSSVPSSLGADIRLFAGTFLAGFLFVSILIG
jgi:hypothetical protein